MRKLSCGKGIRRPRVRALHVSNAVPKVSSANGRDLLVNRLVASQVKESEI
jgi:hypothetical protein